MKVDGMEMQRDESVIRDPENSKPLDRILNTGMGD